VREIIQTLLKKEVTKTRQGRGFDRKIGVQEDPMEIGDLITGRCLIYIWLVVWPWLSPSSSVNTFPLLPLFYLALTTMSNIYCHEDVINFTDPFLDFDQGYQAPRKVAAIPVSLRTILPEKPMTCRGYPRGESQGQSSGWCPSLLPF